MVQATRVVSRTALKSDLPAGEEVESLACNPRGSQLAQILAQGL